MTPDPLDPLPSKAELNRFCLRLAVLVAAVVIALWRWLA